MKNIIVILIMLTALFDAAYAQIGETKSLDKSEVNELMQQTSFAPEEILAIENLYFKYNAMKRERMEDVNQNAKSKEEENEAIPEMFPMWYSLVFKNRTQDGSLVNRNANAWNEYYKYKNQYPTNAKTISYGFWSNAGCTTINHQVGQGSSMGRMNCIKVDPNNASIIYAGASAGGLWKSIDSGNSWDCITDAIPCGGITAIAINPLNSNEIYAVTGDGDYGLSTSIGVIKTYNGGFTWQKTGLTFPVTERHYGRSIDIDPLNPNNVVAAFDSIVKFSYDAGQTWSNSLVLNSSNVPWQVKYKPGTSNVYVCTKNRLYYSLTNGTSWPNVIVGTNGLRSCISFSKLNNNHLYFLHGLTNGKNRLYKSTTTSTTPSFTLMADTPNVMVGQNGFDIDVEASANSINTVYTGILDVYKSTANGASLNQISLGPYGVTNYVHVDIHDIEMVGNTLWVASDGGVYKSTDNGATWSEKNSGLMVTWATNIDFAPGQSKISVGSFDNGFEYVDVATNTCYARNGGDAFGVVNDYTNPLIMYFNINGGLNKTTDGGNTSSFITPGNFFLVGGKLPDDVIIHPTNPLILYMNGKDIFKTTDGGITNWTRMFCDTTWFHPALEISKSNPNYLYTSQHPDASSSNPKLMQYFNGTSWVNCFGNLPSPWNYGFYVTDISVNPTDPGHVWVCFSGLTAGNKVYETLDYGATWYNRSGSLPNVSMATILNTGGVDNRVFVGTEIGVYFKDNTMTDWVPYMNNLPRCLITDLDFDNVTGDIYAATCGRGIYKTSFYSGCAGTVFVNEGSNPDFTGYSLFEAANYLLSDKIFNEGYGVDAHFRAGNYVQLNPGFEASNGSEFKASIGSCGTAPPIAPPPFTELVESEYKHQNEMPNKSFIQNEAMDMNIFPNPIQQQFNIQFKMPANETISITVIDINGKVIEHLLQSEDIESGSHSMVISASHWKPGVYTLEVETTESKLFKKVVKL